MAMTGASHFRRACELVRNGRIGKLHTVRCGLPGGRPDYGKTGERKKPERVPDGFDYAGAVRRGARLRVATKYVQTAREFFAGKGVHVDLIKLYGSMELAPLAGLADAIVDLVSTGGTLRANRLVEVEQIAAISSRLIVNQAAYKLRHSRLAELIDAIGKAVES